MIVPTLSKYQSSIDNRSGDKDAILPILTSKNNNATISPPSVIIETPHDDKNNNSWKSNHRHPHFLVEFPLCLVHVGKAAGSSVSCGLGLFYADCEGMPRDKLPQTHFFHMRRNNCPLQTTQTYLVTLRNPLTRMQSWFDFEKNIVPSRHNNPQEEAKIKRQRGMLFTECYGSFVDLVAIGLRPLALAKANNQSVVVSVSVAKPVDMTCPERAWAAILGVRAFSYHEWYNYEYYWTGMHNHGYNNNNNNNNTNQSLKVLRTEHLQEDWATISTETLFRPVNRRKSNQTSTTTSTTIMQLLDNKEAMENLCRALCPEIQIYKEILQHADNLDDAQHRESIQEVQALCPFETVAVRECPGIPTFPPIRVPRRQYQTETKKRLYQIKT
jgi:hypothetical protein